MQPHPIRFVDLTVADLGRSIWFYTELLDLAPVAGAGPDQAWLSAGTALLRLTQAVDARAGAWQAEDVQRGFRHVGFKVGDLDERAARLREAGARFHKEPKDVPGGVRITFFFDPDGVLLELVQGHLRYDRVEDPGLVAIEHDRPAPTTPRFDHVAITVADRDATVRLYQEALGLAPAGRLLREDDPRGFEITYLHAGSTVLELFSWGVETVRPSWDPDPAVLGFRGIGVVDDDPAGCAARLMAGDSTRLSVSAARPTCVDSDGLAISIDRPGDVSTVLSEVAR